MVFVIRSLRNHFAIRKNIIFPHFYQFIHNAAPFLRDCQMTGRVLFSVSCINCNIGEERFCTKLILIKRRQISPPPFFSIFSCKVLFKAYCHRIRILYGIPPVSFKYMKRYLHFIYAFYLIFLYI